MGGTTDALVPACDCYLATKFVQRFEYADIIPTSRHCLILPQCSFLRLRRSFLNPSITQTTLPTLIRSCYHLFLYIFYEDPPVDENLPT